MHISPYRNVQLSIFNQIQAFSTLWRQVLVVPLAHERKAGVAPSGACHAD